MAPFVFEGAPRTSRAEPAAALAVAAATALSITERTSPPPPSRPPTGPPPADSPSTPPTGPPSPRRLHRPAHPPPPPSEPSLPPAEPATLLTLATPSPLLFTATSVRNLGAQGTHYETTRPRSSLDPRLCVDPSLRSLIVRQRADNLLLRQVRPAPPLGAGRLGGVGQWQLLEERRAQPALSSHAHSPPMTHASLPRLRSGTWARANLGPLFAAHGVNAIYLPPRAPWCVTAPLRCPRALSAAARCCSRGPHWRLAQGINPSRSSMAGSSTRRRRTRRTPSTRSARSTTRATRRRRACARGGSTTRCRVYSRY